MLKYGRLKRALTFQRTPDLVTRRPPNTPGQIWLDRIWKNLGPSCFTTKWRKKKQSQQSSGVRPGLSKLSKHVEHKPEAFPQSTRVMLRRLSVSAREDNGSQALSPSFNPAARSDGTGPEPSTTTAGTRRPNHGHGTIGRMKCARSSIALSRSRARTPVMIWRVMTRAIKGERDE